MICPKYKEKINDFLQFDYSGAPWAHQGVGNGGLSLRRKSKMLNKIRKCILNGEDSGTLNEDAFFSDDNCEAPLKPDFENAKLFSSETVYSEKSFGIHASWKYLSNDDVKKQTKSCGNGLKTLIELNK
jgi:hypothetical protein